MRLLRYAGPGGAARVGVLEGDTVHDAGTSLFTAVKGETVGSLAEVRLLAPVDRPRKVICVGMNYADHCEELGQPQPETPNLFGKYDNAIVGPGEDIVVPSITKEVDYEAELGVVIGTRAQNVPVESALEHVLGYTCVNDVSARDLQFWAGDQWLRGKNLDTFCPVGPYIVTPDEVPDVQALGIRCVVNGNVVQKSSTDQMVKGVAELVSFISQAMTLEPGDLISTGTPGGVGFKRTPPLFLRDGDVVRIEIDGIGELENPVRAARS